jgi:hypothetical protein
MERRNYAKEERNTDGKAESARKRRQKDGYI